ncbi:MAG: magnesium transporter [Solirubrobacteraceae bacterium]|nr:magnesium transporter [Solirubrobacteraceae bacterium]
MEVLTEVDETRIKGLLERDEFFWLDLQSSDTGQLDTIGSLLRLHPMALEDTREFGQRPKIDVYDEHVLVVFYTARAGDERPGPVAITIEVHVYVSGGFVVTIRREACDLLDRLHDSLVGEGTDVEDYLVYRVFDTLTDAWYPVVTAIEERVDVLEGEVLEHARQEQLRRIYRLRQEVREHHRLLIGQRDHFQPAAEAIRNLAGLSRGAREYLRDVGDHLAQVAGEFARQNDDLMALAQTYFNANADRVNTVATRITILGTLFLTWTLVTGFFGQNFGWLVDHINGRHSFLVYGVGGLLVPTVILLGVFWIKRDDWF